MNMLPTKPPKNSIWILSLCLLALFRVSAQQFPFQNPELSSEERAKDLISRLTLEEKATLICEQSGAIPRLAIKKFNWWSEALLQAWCDDEASGQPIANILFGDYNPSGELPISFYKNSDKLGDFQDYSMVGRTYNGFGNNGTQTGLPVVTPWRTITVGETLKPMVETSLSYSLVEPLYESSQYIFGKGTWSWIVWQGKSMNYDDQINYIDLTTAINFEYNLIDAWWDKNIGYDRARADSIFKISRC